MPKQPDNGSFDDAFAASKRWKVDEGLLNGLLAILPRGCSLNDLGAGLGKYVGYLREKGWDAHGYDGIPRVVELSNGLVSHADLSSAGLIGAGIVKQREWTMCIEVGEHVPERHENRFLANLAQSATSGLIVSWATPGQRGRNHVNCRLPEYVACMLGKHGWNLDHALTMVARKHAGRGWDRKLMVFRV